MRVHRLHWSVCIEKLAAHVVVIDRASMLMLLSRAAHMLQLLLTLTNLEVGRQRRLEVLLVLLIYLVARLSMLRSKGLEVPHCRSFFIWRHYTLHLHLSQIVRILTQIVQYARDSWLAVVVLEARILLIHESLVDNGRDLLLLSAAICLSFISYQSALTFDCRLKNWLRLAALQQNGKWTSLSMVQITSYVSTTAEIHIVLGILYNLGWFKAQFPHS